MLKFKKYIIITLFLLLFFIFYLKKEYFLTDSDIKEGKHTYSKYEIDIPVFIIRMDYSNDCGIIREFLYGCCEKIKKKGAKISINNRNFKLNKNEYNQNNYKMSGSTLSPAINNFVENDYSPNKDLYLGNIDTTISSSPPAIQISKITSKDYIECPIYQDFIDQNGNIICPIENGDTNFNKLKKFLGTIDNITFKFEFIHSNEKVPIFRIFRENVNMMAGDPETYLGDINNFCNLSYFILEYIKKNTRKIDGTSISIDSDIAKKFIKDKNNLLDCISGDLSVNSEKKQDLLEAIDSLKVNGNFLDNRPKLLLNNLLFNKDYSYILILTEHQFLKEQYVINGPPSNVLYWSLWGLDISNIEKFVNGIEISSLFIDEEESSSIVQNNYQLYPYFIFDSEDLQLLPEDISLEEDVLKHDIMSRKKKLKLNFVKGVFKNTYLKYSLHLLKKEQYNNLKFIYDEFSDKPSIFYHKFISEITNIQNTNKKTYNVVPNNIKLTYTVKKSVNISKLNKYYNLPQKYNSLFTRLLTAPHNIYNVTNKFTKIKIQEDGYYEIILTDLIKNPKDLNENNETTTIKVKFNNFSNEVGYFLNEKHNRTFIPYNFKRNDILNINSTINCKIIIRKTRYISKVIDFNGDANIQRFLINDDTLNFRVSTETRLDILVYLTDTNINEDIEKNDLTRYKILDLGNDKKLIIFRHLIDKTKNISFKFNKLKDLIIKSKKIIIVYYPKKESITKIKITDDNNNLTKLNNNYYKNKIFKNSYLNLKGEEPILLQNKDTIYKLYEENVNNNNSLKILNKELEFRNIGPDYCLLDHHIKELLSKRINNNIIDRYCDIKNIVPTVHVKLKTLKPLDDLLEERNLINENLKNLKGCLRIYYGDKMEDIKNENLIYFQFNINIDKEILINSDNGYKTGYYLHEKIKQKNKRIKYINLLLKFDLYEYTNDSDKVTYDVLDKVREKLVEKNMKNSFYNNILNEISNKSKKTCPSPSNSRTQITSCLDYSYLINNYIQSNTNLEKIDDILLIIIDNFITKINLIELTNYSSFGQIALKQNISKIEYQINSFDCKDKRIEIFDEKGYKDTFILNTSNTKVPALSDLPNNIQEEENSNKKEEKKTKTIEQIIDEYKQNIFNVYN